MNDLDMSDKVNFPALMIKHMRRVTFPKTGPHGLAYGFLLLIMFEKFDVTLGKGVAATRYDRFTLSIMHELDCLREKPIGMKSTIPITQTLMELEAAQKKIAQLKEENAGLRECVGNSQAQIDYLK